MLLYCPHIHLKESSQREKKSYKWHLHWINTWKRVSQNGKEDPWTNLSKVIGTRDELKKRSHGNWTLLGTISLTHTTELEMNSSIDTFAKEHANQSKYNNVLVCYRSVKWMTQSVSNLHNKDEPTLQREHIPNNKYNSWKDWSKASFRERTCEQRRSQTIVWHNEESKQSQQVYESATGILVYRAVSERCLSQAP